MFRIYGTNTKKNASEHKYAQTHKTICRPTRLIYEFRDLNSYFLIYKSDTHTKTKETKEKTNQQPCKLKKARDSNTNKLSKEFILYIFV